VRAFFYLAAPLTGSLKVIPPSPHLLKEPQIQFESAVFEAFLMNSSTKHTINTIDTIRLSNFLVIFNVKVLKFYTPLFAMTHIATLGWITMTIFGALFQLIPVALQVKLFSEILAEIQFWIFSLGVFTSVYSFCFFWLISLLL
jgi:cbb3-type cytochrome oxidase subunit 1